MKIYFKISTLIFFLTYHLTSAQQIKSPLEASFDDYQHLKEDSHFHLDWVSLGPMLAPCRVVVDQMSERNVQHLGNLVGVRRDPARSIPKAHDRHDEALRRKCSQRPKRTNDRDAAFGDTDFFLRFAERCFDQRLAMFTPSTGKAELARVGPHGPRPAGDQHVRLTIVVIQKAQHRGRIRRRRRHPTIEHGRTGHRRD